MTFAAFETSADSGKPVELLLIQFMTREWAFTTADVAILFDGHTFVPLPFDHSAIKGSGDVSKTTITVRVPRDAEVGELFRVQPPSGVVSLTLFVKHADDNEVKTFWKGRIVNTEWMGQWLTLTVENASSSMKRLGLRRKFGSQCPHPVYSQGEGLCNVDKEAFKQSLVVSAITGNVVNAINAGALGGDYFAGGEATWVHATEGYLERRMITTSDISGNVTLVIPPKGLIVGQVINLYPGCDHLPTICHARFNNKLNYGGQEFIPRKNPFAGTILY